MASGQQSPALEPFLVLCLGGVLVNAFGWRSIFLINLPIGILGFLLTLRSIAPSTPQGGLSPDLPGQVAGMLALGMLTFALIEGNSLGILSPLILTAYEGQVQGVEKGAVRDQVTFVATLFGVAV